MKRRHFTRSAATVAAGLLAGTSLLASETPPTPLTTASAALVADYERLLLSHAPAGAAATIRRAIRPATIINATPLRLEYLAVSGERICLEKTKGQLRASVRKTT